VGVGPRGGGATWDRGQTHGLVGIEESRLGNKSAAVLSFRKVPSKWECGSVGMGLSGSSAVEGSEVKWEGGLSGSEANWERGESGSGSEVRVALEGAHHVSPPLSECLYLLRSAAHPPVVLRGVLISTHRVLASTPVSTTSECRYLLRSATPFALLAAASHQHQGRSCPRANA
jgi:hypothetical protein